MYCKTLISINNNWRIIEIEWKKRLIGELTQQNKHSSLLILAQIIENEWTEL